MPTFMRDLAFSSFRRFPALSSLPGILALQFLLLILAAGEVHAVRPYRPVHPDPVLEPWRWQSFPELKGLGFECLAEDREGKMWFGTDEGVRRYDGLTWTVYTPEDGVYGRPVLALCVARDGSVYAGTEVGISRFVEGTWRRVFPPEGDLSWPVFELRQVSDGGLWAATRWGALCLGPAGATLYTDRGSGAAIQGMAPYVRVVSVPDAAAPVYAWPKEAPIGVQVTEGGVIRAVAAGGPEAAAGLKPGDRIVAVDGDAGGVAARLEGPLGSRVRLTVHREGQAEAFEVATGQRPVEATYRDFWVSDILEDREGAVWLGMYRGGLVRFDRGGGEGEAAAWRLYTDADGLESGFRPRLAQRRDGSIWMVTDPGDRGVSRFDGRSWTHFRLRDYGGFDNHTSILETGDGVLWIGGKFALHALREGEWRVYRAGDVPIPSHRVRLLEASDGALWMAGQGQEAVRPVCRQAGWITGPANGGAMRG